MFEHRIRRLLPILVLVATANASETPEQLSLEQFQAIPADSQVLLLGTFHFKDAGLDSYKPEVDIDIQSPSRQRELDEVLQRIAERFKPTRIALEGRDQRAKRMAEEEYPAYLAGNFELGPNEIYQIGFRLGKLMALPQLEFVDVLGRNYPDLPEDLNQHALTLGQGHLMENPWDDRFTALYRHGDRMKAQRSLRATFLAMNSPERLMAGHGHYLLGSMAVGMDGQYPGADLVTGWWYNRNLRIFANIRRLMKPGDRILVVIGAGHVPIIRHAVQASPEMELVEVSEILGD